MIDIQHYIRFKRITQWFDTCLLQNGHHNMSSKHLPPNRVADFFLVMRTFKIYSLVWTLLIQKFKPFFSSEKYFPIFFFSFLFHIFFDLRFYYTDIDSWGSVLHASCFFSCRLSLVPHLRPWRSLSGFFNWWSGFQPSLPCYWLPLLILLFCPSCFEFQRLFSPLLILFLGHSSLLLLYEEVFYHFIKSIFLGIPIKISFFLLPSLPFFSSNCSACWDVECPHIFYGWRCRCIYVWWLIGVLPQLPWFDPWATFSKSRGAPGAESSWCRDGRAISVQGCLETKANEPSLSSPPPTIRVRWRSKSPVAANPARLGETSWCGRSSMLLLWCPVLLRSYEGVWVRMEECFSGK